MYTLFFLACWTLNPYLPDWLIVKHIYVLLYIIKSFSLFGLTPKTICHKNKYIVYFKKHQEISDVLKVLGANKSMFKIEERKIESDLVNNYQRLINLEISNLKKTAAANVEQVNICTAIKSKIKIGS